MNVVTQLQLLIHHNISRPPIQVVAYALLVVDDLLLGFNRVINTLTKSVVQ